MVSAGFCGAHFEIYHFDSAYEVFFFFLSFKHKIQYALLEYDDITLQVILGNYLIKIIMINAYEKKKKSSLLNLNGIVGCKLNIIKLQCKSKQIKIKYY